MSAGPRRHEGQRRRRLVLGVLASLALTACVGTSHPAAVSTVTTSATVSLASIDTAATDTTTEPPPTSTTAPAARPCVPPTTTPVQAVAMDDVGQEWDITSFDGAVIRAHWFPGSPDDATAPTVLMGPGWGSAGDTDTAPSSDPGSLGIAGLRAAGFNVLTWDPRGFGVSTGIVEFDSPEYEGRDVEQLLDWVATRPGVQLDGPRDPRVGMFGASYGGGIQLVTASIDCRIDAIVPVIAWHSLQTSLFKADTPKTGWGNFLSAASAGRAVDPTMVRANAAANATGRVDPADVRWFADRGPADAVAHIRVPTLIIQGTVDTLFTLDEAVSNLYELPSDVPSAMLWFCGGHGACLTRPGSKARPSQAALAWLRRYVAQDTSVTTGHGFEFVDQDGVSYTADAFPAPTGDFVSGTGSGTLPLVADGGSGPAVIAPSAPGLAPLVAPITPGRASNAVNVSVPARDEDTILVGAPRLTFTYGGTNGTSGSTPASSTASTTASEAQRPTRIFAQLVDDATNIVLGNQITPIGVILDGATHTVSVPLEMVAFTAHPGSTITLQLVATTVAYALPRLDGSIDFTHISIELPIAHAVTRAG